MRLLPDRLSRYIFSEIVSFFLICLFAFTGILLTIRMLKFAALIINKNVNAAHVGLVFISIIPTFLEIAIPLAALLGVMLAYARLSGDSEIIVMRASGINLYQLLKAPLIFGLVCSVAAFTVSHYLRPWGFQTLSQTFFSIARSRSTAGLDAGIFNKLGVITLYAEDISAHDGRLQRVLIDDQREKQQRKIIVAQNGQIVSDAEAKMIIFHLYDGYIHEQIEGNYVVTQFTSNSLILEPDELYGTEGGEQRLRARELYPKTIKILTKELRDLPERISEEQIISRTSLSRTLAQFVRPDELSPKNLGKKYIQLLIEQNLRISMSVASLFLALIAVPLGISPPRMQRTWGSGLSVLVGIGVFMIYYALLTVGMTLAESRVLPPTLALWLPNIIAALVGYKLITGFAHERWNSLAEWSEIPLGRIKNVFRRRA
jgi:lipopolysaccharide export system permease protein